MWNRRDSETSNAPTASAVPPTAETPARDAKTSWERPAPQAQAQPQTHAPAHAAPPPVGRREGTIGKSIRIRGELTGNEDLTIEGKVEGKIELMDHNLTIGGSGRIEGEINAKAVVVQGEVHGNITAGDKVELASSSRVKGDVLAPRVVIADGAHFKGMVNMTEAQPERAQAASRASTTTSPAAPPRKKESETATLPVPAMAGTAAPVG